MKCSLKRLWEGSKGSLNWLRTHPQCSPERVQFFSYLTYQTTHWRVYSVYKVRKFVHGLHINTRLGVKKGLKACI